MKARSPSLAVLLLAACIPCASAQSSANPLGPTGLARAVGPAGAGKESKSAAPADEGDLEAKLAQAKAELERITGPGRARVDVPASIGDGEAIERRLLLERLVTVYARHVQSTRRLGDAQQRATETAARARQWSGFSAPPPYSVLLVDGLRRGLLTATLQTESSTARARIAADQLEQGRADFDAADQSLRQIQERLESPAGADRGAVLSGQRDLAQLRHRLAAATLAFLDTEAKVAGAELAEYGARTELLRKQLAVASRHIKFGEEDLRQALADLQAQQTVLDEGLRRAETNNNAAQIALYDAQTESPRAGRRGGDPGSAQQLVELRRAQADNAGLALQLARLKVDACALARSGWQYRLLVYNSENVGKLREAYNGITDVLHRVQPWKRYVDGQIALVIAQLDEQRRQVLTTRSSADTRHLMEMQTAFHERLAIYRDAQELLETMLNMLTLWEQQFAEDKTARPFRVSAEDALGSVSDAARGFWNFELFAAEDTLEIDGKKVTGRRSVTVGKSIGAVMVLVLGYLAMSWLLRRAELELARRRGVDPNMARILRRWGEFIVVAVLFVFALHLVKIPLTVFAFLGGALAIGVGFGAQNLLKNLMSGIILLVERPLRVGDVVQVGATVGAVTNISVRASTVRSGNGVETLIPNSNFLENVVTNWTYSDRLVRNEVRVSVAREASTRKVSELLLATVQRHGQVLKEPTPRVLLQDVGVAMTFAVQYWTEIGSTDGDIVASDLRLMIEGALKEADIPLPTQVALPKGSAE